MTTPTLTNTLMGFEGNMYVGAAGSGATSSSGMTLAENVSELKLPAPGSYGEVEHTLKKHKGQKAYQKGMRDWIINFSVSKERVTTTTTSSDNPPVTTTTTSYAPDVQMILDALHSRTPIHLLLEDFEGGEGPVGDFLLFGSEYSGSGEEAQIVPIVAKPYAGAPAVQWQRNGTVVDFD